MAKSITTSKLPAWPRWFLWALGALAIIQMIVLVTSPVKDGDLFWQMAYGKYAIENTTLIADHAAFTWSHADTTEVYCCWFAQIFLYALHSLGGFFLLFAFKYAVCLLFLGLTLHIGQLTGTLKNPLLCAIWLVGMAMANHSGAVLKPEIFSFLGIILSAYVWTRIRLTKSTRSKLPYWLPLIMLIWVNSHGAVVFGVTFIILMWLGEEMNALFSPREALPRGTRKHLFIAVVLCGAALFATPYGVGYPMSLARTFLGTTSVSELKTISDYQHAFSSQGKLLHLPAFLIASVLLLVAIRIPFAKKLRLNWVITLNTLLFVFLYCYMLRTTYFWGAIFVFTNLYLLSECKKSFTPSGRKWQIAMAVIPAIIAILISKTILDEKVKNPVLNRWFGYGSSYTNPIEESAYIKEHLSTFKIGNDYDSGAYLLWTLYPETKHMIDPRYFPFKHWYADYYNALKGRNTQQFVSELNCDVWCVGFLHREAIDWFQKSPDWKPLFYGARAVVFGRSDLYFEPTEPLGGKELDDIRVLGRALHVLTFAINIGDWEGATRIYRGANDKFVNNEVVAEARRLLEGIFSFHSHDFDRAAEYLKPPDEGAVFHSEGILLNTYAHLTAKHWNDANGEGAFTYAQAALLLANKDMASHFNYGVIGSYLESQGIQVSVANQLPSWRQSLEFFLANFDKVNNLPSQSTAIARALLDGTTSAKPPVIEPPKPDENQIESYLELLEKLGEEQ